MAACAARRAARCALLLLPLLRVRRAMAAAYCCRVALCARRRPRGGGRRGGRARQVSVPLRIPWARHVPSVLLRLPRGAAKGDVLRRAPRKRGATRRRARARVLRGECACRRKEPLPLWSERDERALCVLLNLGVLALRGELARTRVRRACLAWGGFTFSRCGKRRRRALCLPIDRVNPIFLGSGTTPRLAVAGRVLVLSAEVEQRRRGHIRPARERSLREYTSFFIF